MTAIVVGVFLVAAGAMADRHRWLLPTLLAWSSAIAVSHWLRGAYDDATSAAHFSAVIVALVMTPTFLGWSVARLIRRARTGGTEWDDVPRA